MFSLLADKLQGVFRNLSGQGKISESNITDALREVRMALLEADVHFQVAKDFIARVKEKALGAEVAINYRDQDFVSVMKDAGGANLILDMVGGPYIERNIKALADGGRLVQIAFLQGAKVTLNLAEMMTRRLTLTGSTLRPQSDLAKARIARAVESEVWPLIERGAVRVVMDSEHELAQAAAAHWRLESGGHVGKIVLRVSP